MGKASFAASMAKLKEGDKPKREREPLKLDDFIGGGEIETAKEEGRFVSLPVASFVPDPNQPRTEFDQEDLDKLQKSMESDGQLQPLLVRPMRDGVHVIIAGERRWRAAKASSLIKTLDAVIAAERDAIGVLAAQVGENRQRKGLKPLEMARACAEMVELCRQAGCGRDVAAEKLLLSNQAQLSKYLSLLDNEDVVAQLGDIDDVDTLYNLARAAEHDLDAVLQFVEAYRDGSISGSVRAASEQVAREAKAGSGQEKNIKSKKTENNAERALPPKAKSFSFDKLDDGYCLVVHGQGKKRMEMVLDAEAMINLKAALNRVWDKNDE